MPVRLARETDYVLRRFGMRQPVYLSNIGTRVRDMEIRKIPGVSHSLSLKKAWNMMADLNAVTLPIVNRDNGLSGLITINDIATSYMEERRIAPFCQKPGPLIKIFGNVGRGDGRRGPRSYFYQWECVDCRCEPGCYENYIMEHDMVIMGNGMNPNFRPLNRGPAVLLSAWGRKCPDPFENWQKNTVARLS